MGKLMEIFDGVRGGNIEFGTVAVNPTSLTTLTAVEIDVTITGATTNDNIIVMPNEALETGLVVESARVKSADTVGIKIFNASAGTIDGASLSYAYMLMKNQG